MAAFDTPRSLPSARSGALASLRTLAGYALDLLLFAALAVALFQRQLFGDGFVPFDFVEQHWLFQSQVAYEFKHLGLTEWTRYIFAGYPSIGDPLFARFYPPNVLMYLLSPVSGLPLVLLEWNLALHYAAAAFFAYLLARDLGANRYAAWVAGIVFGCGGFMASHAQFLEWINAVPWIPLALWALRRALLRRSAAYWVLAAAAVGLLALAGHAQTTLYAGYSLGLWALVVSLAEAKANRRQALLWGVLAKVGAVATGAAIAAVELLPAAELASASSRSAFSYADAAVSSLNPAALLTLLLPEALGHGYTVAYWAPGDIAETYFYAGAATLLLAGLALFVRRRPLVWAMAGLAALSLVLALGQNTPLHRMAFDWLPGFANVRRPAGAMLFFSLWLGLLAALGLDALWSARPFGRGMRLAVVAGLALCLIVGASAWLGAVPLPSLTTAQAAAVRFDLARAAGLFALSTLLVAGVCLFPRGRAIFSVGLAVLVAAEVVWFGAGKGFNFVTDQGYNRTIAYDYVGDRHGSAAVYLRGDPDYRNGTHARLDQALADHLWANGTGMLQIDGTWGYSQLRLREYDQFVNGIPRSAPAYALLGAKYAVALGDQAKAPEFAPGGRFDLVLEDGAYKIYHYNAALPRAFVVGETVVAGSADDALQRLRDAAFDPSRTAVVAQKVDLPATAGSRPATVQWLADEQDRLRLRVNAPDGGLLVLSDPFYPGWTATLDGAPAPIVRANLAFRGVVLPAGEHEVAMSFRDEGFALGVWVSGSVCAALVVGLLGLAILRRRERRQNLVVAVLLAALALATAVPWLMSPASAASGRQGDLLAQVNRARVDAPSPTLDVAGKRYASVLQLETAGEWREALLLHPPAKVEFPLSLAENSTLHVGVAIYKNLWEYTDGVTFIARLRQGSAEREVFRQTLSPKTVQADRRWLDVDVPLGNAAGDAVLMLASDAGPAGDTAGDWALWGPIRVDPPGAAPATGAKP